MTEPVTMIARIRPKPGQEAKLRNILTGLVPPTRREAGCIAYYLHEHGDGEGCRFSFYEIWRTEAELTKHMQTAHVTGFISQLDELVSGEIDVERMRAIGE